MTLVSGQDHAHLFRVYHPEELGADGYPVAWSRIEVDDLGIGVLTTRPFGIKDIVRAEAGHRCIRCGHPYRNGQHGNGEWSECDDLCTHGGPLLVDGGIWAMSRDEIHLTHSTVEAQWRILTVHHLTGDKADCRWWNLVALCQRDHLAIQGRVVMDRAFILEHSDWFKPYAAGWYAWKYLGEEISRDEATTRQDELLGLERLA